MGKIVFCGQVFDAQVVSSKVKLQLPDQGPLKIGEMSS